MQQILFLEGLGVSRDTIQTLISESGLSLTPVWADPESVESPEEVVAIVTVMTTVSDRILDRFPNARLIAVAFTGYDFLDLEACRRRGVAVYNVPAYSTDSVAELVLGMTICLLRDVARADRKVRAGGWQLESWGTELADKVVGIIGTGAIGLRVAELFKALKCRLIGWSRTERKEFIDLGGVYLPRETVFAEADVVSIHVALNKETDGLIGVEELAVMRPGACLINTARGRVVDKAALALALQDGRIRAGIDVFDQEPIPADDPLIQAGHALLTPHMAFKTNEALLRRARVTIGNIKAFLDGDDHNRVA